MNVVPEAGVVPVKVMAAVPAAAASAVTVRAMNAGNAGGTNTVARASRLFTQLTFTKHCVPVRLIVWPRLFTTVNDCAKFLHASR